MVRGRCAGRSSVAERVGAETVARDGVAPGVDTHAPAPKRPLDLRHPLVLLRWGSLVVPLIVLVVVAIVTYRQERAAAEAYALQNAQLLAQYTLRIVETQSAVLDRMADLTELAAPAQLGPDAFTLLHQRFARLVDASDYVLSLGLVAPDGTILAASRAAIMGLDVSDRDYFRALAADPTQIFVDRVRLISDETDALVIARVIETPSFTGIVVSTIRVEAITGFFERIAGPGETPGLLREDGKVIVRSRAALPPVVLEPDSIPMQAIAQAREGVFETIAMSDGVSRIYAHTRVDGLPIAAIFGIETGQVHLRWARRIGLGVALFGIIALAGFVVSGQAIRRLAAEAAARKAAFDRSLYEEARKTAAFRETLLREMHHRVKNNLQQVQLLLRGRLRGSDPDAVKEIEDRIWAIAEVHDLLHVSGTVARLDLADLVQAVCTNPAIVPPERGIATICTAEPVEIGIEQGTPLALILVEIVTNAVKHAFPDGRAGTIRVSLRREDGSALLEIADDGIGLQVAGERRRNSGLRLVEGLVRQIGGSVETTGTDGTRTTIRLPLAGAG